MSYTPHPSLGRRAPAELCQLVGDYAGALPNPDGVICEPKIDGWRTIYVAGELITREGAPLYGADHVVEQLKRIEAKLGRCLFFDGEIQVGDAIDTTQQHFHARGRNGDRGVMHIFDMMSIEVWRGDMPSEPLTARRAQLDDVAGHLTGDAVCILPWTFVETAKDAEAFAREIIADGGEGAVLKSPDSLYVRRRSQAWLKLKEQHLACLGRSARPRLTPRYGTPR